MPFCRRLSFCLVGRETENDSHSRHSEKEADPTSFSKLIPLSPKKPAFSPENIGVLERVEIILRIYAKRRGTYPRLLKHFVSLLSNQSRKRTDNDQNDQKQIDEPKNQ